MGTPFNTGQLGKLQNIVNIGVATALPKVAEKLGDPKRVLKALDGRGAIFAGRLELALETAITSMLVIIPRGSTTITLTERHYPPTYYQTREGLWVSDSFREHVVMNARPVEAGETFKVDFGDIGLEDGATDAEIEAGLPRHFEEYEVCAIIAGLIAKQPKGEEGDLLNNGYANLFYTSGRVVDVRWSADDGEWGVDAWRRVDRRWSRGRRVFAPSN